MSLPVPIKVPHDDPAAQRKPNHPVIPPDDPNADRFEHLPEVDPPPTEPPMEEPESIIEPQVRAWSCETAYPVWMRLGELMPTSPYGLPTSLGAA